MTKPSSGTKCSRPACPRVAQNRGLCKHHYPLVYPAHFRGDTDPTAAREHIAALRARGVTVRMLREDHGISDQVLRNLKRSKIRRLSEAKILAIPLPTVWVPTLADVDATGTRRRLQALAAIGWRQDDIGARIGVVQRHIPNLMHRDRVASSSAAKVAAVFDELQMIPGPSDIARRRARRKGWAVPLAWDEETIDDPAAQPYDVTRMVSRGVPPDFADIIAEHRELGHDDAQIAAVMGIKLDSLQQRMRRYGIERDCPPDVHRSEYVHRRELHLGRDHRRPVMAS
jgi:lambda repressor-like predicted transcriptional regulator